MKVTSIEIVEYDSGNDCSTWYTLDAESLGPEEFDELRELLDRSGILLYRTRHRGPAQGGHELSMTVEALDGQHEVVVCDVAFSAEHQELAKYIKTRGTKFDCRESNKRPSNIERPDIDFDSRQRDLKVAS